MNIHAYIICYNEERIIRHVLSYYSQICSKIFVFDNLSTDRSVEIASEFSNVVVIPFDTNGQKDNSKHIQIKTQEYKRYSRKGGEFTTEIADWIICVDMDEIIYHPDLVGVLKSYQDKSVTVPQITGFNMVDESDINSSKGLIEQYRRGVRDGVFDKRAVFACDFDMSYSLGCHPYGAGFELMKQTYGYRSSNEHPIALLHFKHIGSLLLESAVKNYQRFGDVASKGDGPQNVGVHYKRLIDIDAKVSPLLSVAREVFDADGRVLFENFKSASGEKGFLTDGDVRCLPADIDLIRDAALLLEDLDIGIALRLMMLAHRLRPEGPLIKSKVSEYEKKMSKVQHST